MTEFANGTNCTWFGTAQEAVMGIARAAGDTIRNLCPFCKGHTLVTITENEFWAQIDAFEAGQYPYPAWLAAQKPQPADWKPRPHPGYRAMFDWAKQQPRCFSHIAHLKNSYKKHTGNAVDLTP